MNNQLPAIALALGLAAGCATNPATGERQLMFVSEAQERELGAQSDQQIVAQFGVLPEDAPIVRYVKQVGERVAAHSESKHPLTLRVLDDPIVNAFALPGGYVYVTRGLLAQLPNEAALAGVIGHEVGHVAARHSAQRITKATLANVGLVGVQVLTGAELAGLGGAAAQLLLLKFSRDDEREADLLGVRYASKASYDAAQLSRFFAALDRMEERAESRLPSWASTHPDPGERRERVVELAREAQGDTPGALRVGEEDYLRRLDGLIYGTDPRQGYVQGDRFVHPDLELSFPVPARWEVQNTPAQVTLRSPAGDAAVVVGLMARGAEASAAEFASQEGVEVTQQTALRAGGQPAVRLQGQLAAEEPLAFVSTFVDWGGRSLVFHGISRPAAFAAARPTLVAPVDGLERVSGAAARAVPPVVVRVIEVERDGTFADAVAGHPIPRGVELDLEGLANLNGFSSPRARVNDGTLLKVLERRATTLPAGARDERGAREQPARGR